jgi:nucleoside 2-deoxyribosyltransferase
MTKLVLCPHFTAHVKDTANTERVAVVCAVCGPKNWIAHPGDEDDPFESAGWLEYAQHARETLEPMVKDSAVAMSLYTGEIDPKMALETGYMIMLDKPIITVVSHGMKVPNKLAVVSDEIVEGEIDDPDFQVRFKAAIDRVTAKLNNK